MQYNIKVLHQENDVETVVLLGWKGVDDYMYVDYAPEHHVLQGGRATYREIAEWIRKTYGVHVTNLNIAQINLNIADFNPLVSEAYLETVRRTIEAAKKLVVLRDRYGDRSQPLSLNMHMNHGIYIILPDRKVQMYDRDFDTYMKSFAGFREKCEEWLGDSDVLITVENTDGFRDYEKKAIEYLLQSPCFAGVL